MNETRLLESIKAHEGYRQEPYRDHLGNWTVGWGTLIHDREIRDYVPDRTLGAMLDRLTDRKSHETWLVDGVENAISDAERWLGFMFKELSDARQEVIVEMAYNMGYGRILSFRKFRAAIADQDWEQAYRELLDSRWAEQVKSRAHTLANKFRAG